MDPPCRARYYEGFEYLMRELGGKPHWAKNFEATGAELEGMYGENLTKFREIRNEADPEGMFVGTWHRKNILGEGEHLPLEEVEIGRDPKRGGGYLVRGKVMESEIVADEKAMSRVGSSGDEYGEMLEGGRKLGSESSKSSEESFEMLQKVEASIIMPQMRPDH